MQCLRRNALVSGRGRWFWSCEDCDEVRKRLVWYFEHRSFLFALRANERRMLKHVPNDFGRIFNQLLTTASTQWRVTENSCSGVLVTFVLVHRYVLHWIYSIHFEASFGLRNDVKRSRIPRATNVCLTPNNLQWSRHMNLRIWSSCVRLRKKSVLLLRWLRRYFVTSMTQPRTSFFRT